MNVTNSGSPSGSIEEEIATPGTNPNNPLPDHLETCIMSISLISIHPNSSLKIFDSNPNKFTFPNADFENWHINDPIPYIFSLNNMKINAGDVEEQYLASCWIIFPEHMSPCCSTLMIHLIGHVSHAGPTCYPLWSTSTKSDQKSPKSSHVSILR